MSSTMGHSGKDKLVFLGYIEGAVGEGWNCGAEFFWGGAVWQGNYCVWYSYGQNMRNIC